MSVVKNYASINKRDDDNGPSYKVNVDLSAGSENERLLNTHTRETVAQIRSLQSPVSDSQSVDRTFGVVVSSIDNNVANLPRQFSTQLVRLISGDVGSYCCCCLELKSKGILCNSPIEQHFSCEECLSTFVITICDTEPHRLLKASGRIQCIASASGCKADPWIAHDVRRVINEEALDKYISVLTDFIVRIGMDEIFNILTT